MTSNEPQKTKNRAYRRQATKYTSRREGLLMPLQSAAETIDNTTRWLYNVIRSGELPAFVFDSHGQPVPYNPLDVEANNRNHLYIFQSDLDDYQKRRIRRKTAPLRPYTPELEAQIVELAEKQMASQGYVSRLKIQADLH